MTDTQIRQWILADEALYQWARDEGIQAHPDSDESGDTLMYEYLPTFIEKHRDELIQRIKIVQHTP